MIYRHDSSFNLEEKEIIDFNGKVYDVTYSFNEDKTRKILIDWISYNSSVTKFSWWGGYYNWDGASKETIKEYAEDVRRHRIQVKEFLLDIPINDILRVKDEVEMKFTSHEIANNVLKSLGYKYKAKDVEQ